MNSQNVTSNGTFHPIRVLQVELGQPLPDFAAQASQSGTPYARASLLVRLHQQPLGVIDLTLESDGTLCASSYAPQVWRALGKKISAHLQADGLPMPEDLPLGGLEAHGKPACVKSRDAAIAAAPAVSVVIPTHERPEQLEYCLKAFQKVEYPSYELIIVDNQRRTTRTQELVERMKPTLPGLRYVHEERQGISSARNRGIAESTGEILAFTDDDVRVDSAWLMGMVAGFKSHKDVGCVTGLILPVELEKPSQLWFDQYARFNKGLSNHLYDLEANRPDSPLFPYAAGAFGSGANMAFTRKALDAIGGFDTATGTGTSARGGDDLAAFFDVIVAGYQLLYEPAALAWHSHPTEYEYLCKQAYGYGVGLAAYLTRTFARHPRLALTMLARLPSGVDHMFNPASPKNASKPPDYPTELNRLERLGLLAGPLAYVRSRWENRAWSSMDAYVGQPR